MFPRTLTATVTLTAVLVLACGEGPLSQNAENQSAPAAQSSPANQGGPADQSDRAAVNQEGTVVSDSSAPQPAGPGSSTPPGASNPGAATDDATTERPPTADAPVGGAPDEAALALGVELELPAGMVAVPLSDTYRRSLSLSPSAGLRFLPPERADSDLGELEPADLELRVYDLTTARDLDSWLEETGLAGTASISDHRTGSGLSGRSVCPSTMLSPGCSFVVANGSGRRVYQFIAMSAEAESAIDSARLR